mmetsp:Transcript_19814/g.33998  ORF Transcript_19814/g.33998 Transcript_19814/m.33998 type:complete len:568 (-) Transcript_19814:300-2003(-)|eukprot:CAMPEP_0184699002 /NCGR_PEP_ID=MMETSP0313-20130426/5416_1 /TAXON_ID=2792 /ORGANISM="Porphyridium aerugineum, Strain SAG 1380-2" /LENGTH=567 /DNA_ID=CAMNT_0027158017 /DNA_START=299 /DNA_END=2002 /DNA_ORIENTATION=+
MVDHVSPELTLADWKSNLDDMVDTDTAPSTAAPSTFGATSTSLSGRLHLLHGVPSSSGGNNKQRNEPRDTLFHALVRDVRQDEDDVGLITAKLFTRFITKKSRAHEENKAAALAKANSKPGSNTTQIAFTSPAKEKKHGWQLISVLEAAQQESFLLLSFILPVGFYESREMRLELYTQSNEMLGACNCGFAEIKIADIGLIKDLVPGPFIYKKISAGKPCGLFITKKPQVQLSVEEVARSNTCTRFQMSMRFDKKTPWPYGARAPFLVFYRSERGNQWTPLYRSEVRNKSDFRGKYRFLELTIDLFTLCEYVPTRLLRIEFFQFVSNSAPVLLGYTEFSYASLMASSPESKLYVLANSTPKGAFRATLDLKKSELPGPGNRPIPVFSLQAFFSSETSETFLFLDLSVFIHQPVSTSVFPVGAPWPFGSMKTFVVVSKTESSSSQPPLQLYKSEIGKVDKSGGDIMKFNLIKLSSHLFDNSTPSASPPNLQIEFFSAGYTGNKRLVARTELPFSRFRQLTTGSHVDLDGSVVSDRRIIGDLTVQQAEQTSNNIYFAMLAEFRTEWLLN